MEQSAYPDQHVHVNIYAENSRPIHRHDQSEGSEFLDDAIRMSDLNPGPEITSPEDQYESPKTKIENPEEMR